MNLTLKEEIIVLKEFWWSVDGVVKWKMHSLYSYVLWAFTSHYKCTIPLKLFTMNKEWKYLWNSKFLIVHQMKCCVCH